jgi:hypothetical protein
MTAADFAAVNATGSGPLAPISHARIQFAIGVSRTEITLGNYAHDQLETSSESRYR